MSQQRIEAAKRLLERYRIYEQAWRDHQRGACVEADKQEFIRTMAVIDVTMSDEIEKKMGEVDNQKK